MSEWYDSIVLKIKTALESVFVKKETGKGLSSNDYTNSEKEKLSNLSNYTHPSTKQCSHAHGDITNIGTLGTTANLPLITSTNGKIATGSFGSSANTFCQGNDSRLSDAREPLTHTHSLLDIDTSINTSFSIEDSYTSQYLLGSDGHGYIEAIGIYYDYNNGEMYFPTSTLYDGDGIELAKLNDIPNTSNLIHKTSNNTNLLLADGSNIAQSTFATSGHTHTVSQISGLTTVQVVVTYTNGTTETLNLYKS